MNTFLRFFYEFISIFFGGLFTAFGGLIKGVGDMFKIKDYSTVVDSYKTAFNGKEWIFVTLAVGVLVIIVLIFAFLIFLFVKKVLRRKNSKFNQDELLNEIAGLNDKVRKLVKEKDEIMSMKVSQLGLKEGEDPNISKEETSSDENPEGEEVDANLSDVRFPKLCALDEQFKNFKSQNYGNTFDLMELIDDFRCFSATKLKLYYNSEILRPFFAALACGKLIILQGISGTGKTSLAYAWGKFVKVDSCVSSVEPSWRDKSDFLGYFNEFTKKFNETKALGAIYEAGFDDNIHTIILDEMNLARVEYYFADLLSILEMPNRDEWLVDIVSASWPDDPKKLVKGKLKLPGNLWYIGTINNDDSTFMVTDKVYDRATPIDINVKVDPFECREQDALDINSSYLESLFADAMEKYPVSDAGLEHVRHIDDYVINHFRIAFGNRIMKQLNTFVPVYVGCGGEEIQAIDYFIAKKILRKFDSLGVSMIRDELNPFISFLNKECGKNTMVECIAYIENIKKSI